MSQFACVKAALNLSDFTFLESLNTPAPTYCVQM